jgi:hypothetical protein
MSGQRRNLFIPPLLFFNQFIFGALRMGFLSDLWAVLTAPDPRYWGGGGVSVPIPLFSIK